MKYLFFDIECANVRNGSKMCSFGYVLTDENLNIIEADDIMINPKSEWDFYALKHILAHSKEFYESFPDFKEQYEKIKRLFFESDIAFGHGVTNDVRFLNDDCKRYKLPFIDFVFYDCADIYKEFENDKQIKSLAKVSKEIGEHTQGQKHESKEDALLVYEYTKEMCEQMNTSLKELLQLVGRCKGENNKGRCTYRSMGTKSSTKKRNNGKLYEYFIKNVKPNCKCENKLLLNKKIAVSISYEKKHFKQMLLIIQLITNLGGEYVTSGKDADIFVKLDNVKNNGFVDYCDREYEVDCSIEEGKEVEKINLYEFLGIIGYDEDQIESNYQNVCKKISKIIRKDEVKAKSK